MDSTSFDRLTRLFVSSGSRRALGGALFGSLAAVLGLEDAAAAPCPRGKKRCRKRCIPKKRCCTTANCRPGRTGRICRGGRCRCPAARPRKCRGVCIARSRCCSDHECGAVPRGTMGCRNHACVLVACAPSWGNCDGAIATGCETDLTVDGNCGRCGHVCQGEAGDEISCVAGTCRLVRQHDFTAIDDPQSFVAPEAGIVTVIAIGAPGGTGGPGEDSAIGDGGEGGQGGNPRLVEAWFAVGANEEIGIQVGGAGADGDSGESGGAGGLGGGNGALDGATSLPATQRGGGDGGDGGPFASDGDGDGGSGGGQVGNGATQVRAQTEFSATEGHVQVTLDAG